MTALTDAQSFVAGYIAGIRQKRLYDLAGLYYDQERSQWTSGADQNAQNASTDALTEMPAEVPVSGQKRL